MSFFTSKYTDLLSIVHLTRTLITLLLNSIGFSYFLKPYLPHDDNTPKSLAATLIRELLPISQFSASDQASSLENCSVCISEFVVGDEIRRLPNCCHMFHRTCLDRWMDHDHCSCPLCRAKFVPHDLPHMFNERFWTATGMFDFSNDY